MAVMLIGLLAGVLILAGLVLFVLQRLLKLARGAPL
jgi:hypothetical protein